MASGSYWQVWVQCPFYKRDNSKDCLVCEGVGDARTLTQVFDSRDALKKYMQAYCWERYKSCPLYRMIMEKYED